MLLTYLLIASKILKITATSQYSDHSTLHNLGCCLTCACSVLSYQCRFLIINGHPHIHYHHSLASWQPFTFVLSSLVFLASSHFAIASSTQNSLPYFKITTKPISKIEDHLLFSITIKVTQLWVPIF